MNGFLRDPVCGMPVSPASPWRAGDPSAPVAFCSEFCRTRYLDEPRLFASDPSDRHLRRIAYFSMEIAIQSEIPTYSGGLGILAGDTLRSCADLGLPIVGVTLACRRGYFRQELDSTGRQRERDAPWDPSTTAVEESARAQVAIEGRTVALRAWRHEIRGLSGHVVPVILLDSDLPENAAWDRRITDRLYGGDAWLRLAQEVVLGIGGVRMLESLGFGGLVKFHLNEGHAAFAAWEIVRRHGATEAEAIADARRRCVFTTHTPVPAGRDRFAYEDVQRLLGAAEPYDLLRMLGSADALDTTELALNLSGFSNGVALRHGEVARGMFPGYEIGVVTNGVHSRTWTSPAFAPLFDRHIPGWRGEPSLLRHALRIPDAEVLTAHRAAKLTLGEDVARRTGARLDPECLTLGFGRRAAVYKRAELVLSDPDRLRRLGPIQLVFAGKAHPHDEPGRQMIARVVAALRELAPEVAGVYVPDYDMSVAAVLVAGCDVWLNTPQPPLEASGTSGMKAAHNGVPSLSVLDGWWVEGCIDGVTGWAIDDASSLYERLERDVLPAFADADRWAALMKHAIALDASYFNTHRMVAQYAAGAYLTA